jgi:hypothetical protein
MVAAVSADCTACTVVWEGPNLMVLAIDTTVTVS